MTTSTTSTPTAPIFHSGFVAILGRPNVGKSTLLNRLIGASISIVTPKAQTTRERVLGILNSEDKKNPGQMIFVDTPGIHRAKEGGINAYMVSEAEESLVDTSAVVYLIEPTSALEHESRVVELLEKSLSSGRRLLAKTPLHIVLNKSDYLDHPRYAGRKETSEVLINELVAKFKAAGFENIETHRISARNGDAVAPLLQKLWSALPEGPAYYPQDDSVSDRPMRFFAAEKIREQLLLQLGEELPYACAVKIDQFNESGDLPRIEATIYVERDSQKGMVIGKGATKLKSIGAAARAEIEEMMGTKIFLGLKVDVLLNWSREAAALKALGYALPASAGKKKTHKKAASS